MTADRSMPKITLGTIIKLLIISFFVGWGLSVLDLTPMELLRSMFNRFDQILDWIGRSFGSIVSYVLIGAMVVVPIWLVLFLIDWSKQRGK
jgi:Na+/H+-dicarboxylate symporter